MYPKYSALDFFESLVELDDGTSSKGFCRYSRLGRVIAMSNPSGRVSIELCASTERWLLRRVFFKKCIRIIFHRNNS